MSVKKRIAIINQRYGLDINGGSELYTRHIAERLGLFYDVEVLTSCSKDYTTWENFYSEGDEIINGVKVRRFASKHPRIPEVFGPAEYELVHNLNASETVFDAWIENLGPCCFGLINYVKVNKDKYDLFIVVTYLYFLQVKSIPLISDKVIFIPTAHDEPYIHFKQFETIFKLPKAYIFLTEEEKELIEERFSVRPVFYDVLGVGVDIPESVNNDTFKTKYSIQGDYIIYVGRIDEGKNCSEMFRYFVEYKKRNNCNLKLVLIGKPVIPVPNHPDIINLGFGSDEDKFAGIMGAKTLLLFSKYESLSISVLEAMALGVPVLVNELCKVLKAHCTKSNGGLYYSNYFEFEGALNYLFQNKNIYEQMSFNAKKYVQNNYSWEVIIKRYKQLINKVCEAEINE